MLFIPWESGPAVTNGKAIASLALSVLFFLAPEITNADHERELSGPMSEKDARALNACQMVVDLWELGDLAEAARAYAKAVKEAGGGVAAIRLTYPRPASARRSRG